MNHSIAAARLYSEADVVAQLVRHVALLFGDEARYALEVRSHGRARADVCVLLCGELIAIEAKFTNSRRAIGQAVLNRYFADRSYVAIREQAVTTTLIAEAAGWGLGVVAVSAGGAHIAAPAPHANPDDTLRQRVLNGSFCD